MQFVEFGCVRVHPKVEGKKRRARAVHSAKTDAKCQTAPPHLVHPRGAVAQRSLLLQYLALPLQPRALLLQPVGARRLHAALLRQHRGLALLEVGVHRAELAGGDHHVLLPIVWAVGRLRLVGW